MQRNSREWKVADVVGRTSIANVERDRERERGERERDFSFLKVGALQWHVVVPLFFKQN